MSARSMACLDDASLVSALLDADAGLTSPEAEHLGRCASCAARGAEWEATMRWAAQDARLAVPPAPVDLEPSILAAIRATPQDSAARSAATTRWWDAALAWLRGPAVWRPALAGGLAVAILASVWAARAPRTTAPGAPSHAAGPSSVAAPAEAEPAAAPSPPAAVASAAPRVRQAVRSSRPAAAADSWVTDWAAWDDSTMTQVGDLARTSLRTAVLGSVTSSESGSDAFSAEDPWSELSDLTTEQRAWLAAELAKKMGGS